MKLNYKKLGELIEPIDKKNIELKYDNLLGININKYFINSVANTVGTDLSKYKILENNSFACNLMHVGRDKKIPMALYKGTGAIVSPAYNVFMVKNKNEILPEYLELYFNKEDFDKKMYYLSQNGIRGNLDWKDFINEIIEFPSIEEQILIISISKIINDNIININKTNDLLQKLTKILYKNRFEKYNIYTNEENVDLPLNWKVDTIKNVAEFFQGVQVPVEEQSSIQKDGYKRFIRIIDLTQNDSEQEIRYIADKNRGNVSENDLFMIRYGTPGILGWNYNGIIANNLFKIVPKSTQITTNYLYCYFNSDYIKNYIEKNAASSTMPAINFSTLNNLPILIPDEETLRNFTNSIEIYRNICLTNKIKIEKLSKLRKILIPKLLSGELDLNKIKKEYLS